MTILLFLLIATAFLAYSNGANDNFKGVATLFGSDTTDYKKAIRWATVTTFAGSISAIFLAGTLVKRFSGKGLVPDTIAAAPEFLLAVAVGASLTVILATVIGYPISTTHSLTGALVGAGFTAVGSELNAGVLGKAFFLPLVLSPLMAVALAAGVYVVFRFLRIRFGITKESRLPVNKPDTLFSGTPAKSSFAFSPIQGAKSHVHSTSAVAVYTGRIIGFDAQQVLDAAHYFSAGVVSFARGLNDTPKIVGLMVAIKALDLKWDMLIVGVAIALGGLINARKVAHTMSRKITSMNHGQGFTANLVTGLLVVFASRFGFPVSTTHVSVGSLFGIGAITKKINTKKVGEIFLSWVLTLPIAAFVSALVYFLLQQLSL